MNSVTVGQTDWPPTEFGLRHRADAGHGSRLVGRAAEWGRIRSLLDEVPGGGGALVLSGEQGAGKTTLLDAAHSAASARGMRVVRVNGAEFEADIGLAGLHQLLVPLSADVRELPHRTRRAIQAALDLGIGPAPDRLVVLNAVFALLRHGARRTPTMLMVDDAQWFDEASAEVLAFVARRLAGSRVGVLVALRVGSDSLLRRVGLPEIRLRPPAKKAPANDRRRIHAMAQQGAAGADDITVLRGGLALVDAAVRTGSDAAATAHATGLAVADISRMSPRLALQAAAAEALVAPDEVAADLFQAALDIPGIERWPFEVARLQLAFGERLRRRRATRASRQQLAAALDTFIRLGARPWAERAGAELQATGQTRHRPDGTGPAPLTPQELAIAELAATGLTNKEIGAKMHLSPRTVSAHLYRVFPKLGITSRAALRDALVALPSRR